MTTTHHADPVFSRQSVHRAVARCAAAAAAVLTMAASARAESDPTHFNGHLAIFSESLLKVRAETTICIIACLTNFLTSSDETTSSSVSGRIEPVLTAIAETLQAACENNPDRFYIVSSPMYR